MPQIDTTKVLIGTVHLYVAPADTAMPADTVEYGGAWGASWRFPGATEEGVNFAFERDTNMHYVEEQPTPVAVTVGNSQFRVETALAEATLDNLKLAFGGGTLTTQASGVGVIGKSTLALSDTLDELAVGLEGLNPAGFFRRVYIPRVVSVATVEVANRRNESKQTYNVQLQSICRMNEIQVIDKTAVAG